MDVFIKEDEINGEVFCYGHLESHYGSRCDKKKENNERMRKRRNGSQKLDSNQLVALQRYLIVKCRAQMAPFLSQELPRQQALPRCHGDAIATRGVVANGSEVP